MPPLFQAEFRGVRTFATEQTPSLLLYVGAFLVVVSAFIFVNVSGDQISDLVKLVLMLAGTFGFLGAGVLCSRYARVAPAGRTFLVIGALIAPLDFAAYYVLVGLASPLDAPTLWAVGSLLCAVLYATLRIAGYGRWYSYLFYAALLGAVFGAEAMAKLPLAWAAAPVALLAVLLEAVQPRATPILATLIGPLPRMTSVVAALAGLALVLPIGAAQPLERSALPVELALLTGYYALRAGGGASWERLLAAIGPGATAVAAAWATGVSLAAVGLVSVVVGYAYVAHDLVPRVDGILRRRLPWSVEDLTTLGLAFTIAGVLPLQAFARATGTAAVAYLGAGLLFALVALVFDDRPGRLAAIKGEQLLLPAAVGILIGYRFALDAIGLLPLAVSGVADLARAYAPLSAVAWLGAIAALRCSRAHATTAGGIAATLSVAVSLGSFTDAPVHAVVNLAYAAGAAAAGVRLSNRPVLWIAGVAAMLGTLGLARWSGAPVVWLPLFAVGPGVVAFAAAQVPAMRPVRTTLAQVAVASASFAAALGFVNATSQFRVPPWDTDVWRTTMAAVAVAGAFGGLEAWRRRSRDLGLAAGIALPVLFDMAVATTHPTIPELLTAPFAAYAYAAAWVALRSPVRPLASSAAVFEYAGAALAVGPTAWRFDGFGLLLVAGVVALLLLTAASRWRLAPTAYVSIVALATLAVRALLIDPRLDELRIAFGAALLFLCVANVRVPTLFRTPGLEFAEVVGVALVCVPTAAVVALLPSAYDIDLPVALLLCIELAAVLAVGVVYRRTSIVRAGLVGSCAGGLIFVALADNGEWYAALLGSAMLNAALGIRRLWPSGTGARDRALLGAFGVGVLFLPSLGMTAMNPGLSQNAAVLAGAIGVVVAAGLLGERWITAAALVIVGIEGVIVGQFPALLQPAGVGAGAALLAFAIAFPKFRRGGLPRPFSAAFDAIGAALYLVPTLLLTVSSDAPLQNAVLMAQVLVLFGASLVFRRRWQIMAAVAVLGIQTVRALLDVANRLPNWATFALAGALLLTIGFLLLLKRELFARWQRKLERLWLTWLAMPQ